jgi:ribosomal protein S27AE
MKIKVTQKIQHEIELDPCQMCGCEELRMASDKDSHRVRCTKCGLTAPASVCAYAAAINWNKLMGRLEV